MEYTDFEYDLRRKIVPVAPDPVFVERLNERLRAQKKVFIEKSTNLNSPFLVILGILLGIGLLLYFLGKNRQK